MYLYMSSFSGRPSGVLTHMGDIFAAMGRLDHLFAAICPCGIDADSSFRICEGQLVREEPLELLRRFVDFIAPARTYKIDANFQKSLRLVDCWGDDPIGSGGMDLFEGNTQLTVKQTQELQTLFKPFNGVLQPLEIMEKLRPDDVLAMAKDMKSNVFFRNELAKRRDRLGPEGFELDKIFETVWTYKTIKLRQWAMINGFDSFQYKNESEGGESYVCLHAKTMRSIEVLAFDGEAFYEAQKTTFADHMRETFLHSKTEDSTIVGLCWGRFAKDPALLSFWVPERGLPRHTPLLANAATPS